MATVVTRGTHPALYAEGIRKVYMDEFSLVAPEYTDYMHVASSTKKDETLHKLAGVQNTMPEKPENDAIEYDVTTDIGSKTITHKSYGLGVKISWEAREDELYGKLRNLGRILGRASRLNPDYVAADVLNNHGASGSTYLGFDGKSLLATDHPYAQAGGTWSNRPTNATDLSYTALQTGWIHFRRLKDEDNSPIPLRPTKLLINPEDEFLAMELLNSVNVPHEMSNTVNTLKNKGLSIVPLTFLNDDDLWFMQAPEHDLQFFWRSRMQDDSDLDFDSRTLKFVVFGRNSAGFGEQRGMYGAPGA